jgi:uncharacterized membrane protein YccC
VSKWSELLGMMVTRENPVSLEHSARTAVAVLASFLVARLVRLPEAYWAPISTIVVMQSSMGAALPISVQRFAGTAFGAAMGAVTAQFFDGNIWAFGATILLMGLVCTAARVERSAYRYAGITLAIVVLVPRSSSGWVIALHRFFEVSLGIAVGLAMSALWPERKR